MNHSVLSKFLLHIGDSQLVLSQRLAEWCGHAPELEMDIALANIGLDLLGQARNFLTLAGQYDEAKRDEDQLAYFRTEREFLNLLLCEQPNGDFAQTIVRQWLMDHYHLHLFTALGKAHFRIKCACCEIFKRSEISHPFFNKLDGTFKFKHR
jgi:ring-1,2-phenylacetyl-CoA epoxidase subunit PaaC